MTEIVTPYGRYNTGGDAPRGKKAEVLSVSDGEKMVDQLSKFEPDEIKWSCRRPPEAQETKGPEVAELGTSDERPLELSNAPDSVFIDLESEAAELWLTDVERERLRQQEYPERVEELEKSESQFWGDIRKEAEELEESTLAELKEQALEDTVRNRSWLQSTADKPLTEITAGEMADLINGDSPESATEELKAELAETEAKARSDEEAEKDTEVDPEVLEEAAASFSEKGGYWQDIAEDIRAEELGDVDSVRFGDFGDDTDITVKDTGGERFAEISTESAELQEEIRAVAEETDAKILRDGDRMLAEVSESDVKEFHQ